MFLFAAGREVGKGNPRHAKTCRLILASLYYTEWVQVGLLTGLNVARPHSPEFLSSVLLNILPQHTAVSALAILASVVFQAFVLICIAQLWHLIYVSQILFNFIISDAVQNNP